MITKSWEVRQSFQYSSMEGGWTSLNQHQAPSSSSQPKLPDHRNIPLDRCLATLATQTKGGVRLSLPGLHVCN
jgi:hypothetical protein